MLEGLPEALGDPRVRGTELEPGPALWQSPQGAGQGLEYTDSFGRLPFP